MSGTWKCNSPEWGKGRWLIVNTIKIIIVITDKFIVLLKVKKVDDTIAGTINKIVKGFVTPPVKYNNMDNWIRS